MSKAYEQAGVNIEAGYEAVKRMKSHVERTNRLGVMGTFGGFGGMFDLSALNLNEPVLISGTDGVGTKLKLAFMVDKHDTIGIDCVATSTGVQWVLCLYPLKRNISAGLDRCLKALN